MTRLCGFITGAWYPVLTSHRLARGALRPITVANQPVLLARRPSGEAFAIRDACPHRGIPLSRGALVGNEIECGYHGWRFDGEGCCRAIPSLLDDQQLKLESIRVPCYPLRDLQGLLWLYVPDAGLPERNSAGEDCPPAQRIPDLPDNAKPNLAYEFDFGCSFDHAAIGLMDPAHGAFVHRSWFWRRSLQPKEKHFSAFSTGFRMNRHAPSKNSLVYKILGGPSTTEITFELPGVRIEVINAGSIRVHSVTMLYPATETSTKLIQHFYWNGVLLSALKPVIHLFATTFLSQDKWVMDELGRGLSDGRTTNMMFVKDADTLARWYFQLKKEHLSSRAENRCFQSPLAQNETLRWRT